MLLLHTPLIGASKLSRCPVSLTASPAFNGEEAPMLGLPGW